MKDIEIVDYRSPHHTGKVIKMGAGIQGFEGYEAAYTQGLSVVGGECPTVGLAGGYTRGGGHSAPASNKASRVENSDLFWALSGGGGGTYGVVMSLTSKAHYDIPVSGANLNLHE
jgi:hypothetical protein